MTERAPKLAAIALCSLLAGCSQSFYQLGEALPVGYERRAEGLALAEVLAELGPPQRLSATATGFVMGWEHWRIAEAALGFSLGVLGADALTVDWGDARVDGDFLLIVFDRSRRAVDASRLSWNNDIGGGAAVQPFLGVAPLVDVDDLLVPLPQHAWGAGSLLPPPAAQNLQNRPDMGDTGIEQRGTPRGVGQRSLEL